LTAIATNTLTFIFAAPITPQINAIYVDIRVFIALQWTISPLFDMNISFLVEFADCGGGNLGAP
jgi:hypothetical protein